METKDDDMLEYHTCWTKYLWYKDICNVYELASWPMPCYSACAEKYFMCVAT